MHIMKKHIGIRLVQRDFQDCHLAIRKRDNFFHLTYRNRSTIYRDQIFEESYRSLRDSMKRQH